MFDLAHDPQVLLLLPTTDNLIQLKNRQVAPPAYGLNILATALRDAGVETIVLDECTIAFHPVLSQCQTWQEAMLYVLECFPSIRLVGFSMLTNFRKEVATLSRFMRSRFPKITIAWGGPHVTALGSDLRVRYANLCDVMVAGPVDDVILQQLLVCSQGSQPSSPVFFHGKHPRDIAHTVTPRYEQYLQFLQSPLPRLIVRTSIGCPTPGCVFCSAPMLEGRYTPNTVAIGARRVRDTIAWSPSRLEFHDQDLFYSLTRMRDVLPVDALSLVAQCYCHAGVDSITTQHLDFLRGTAPMWTVFVGLESASAKLYRLICKRRLGPQSLDNLANMVRYARSSNIHFGMFVMFGIPGEESADVTATVEFLKRLEEVEISCSLMKVFPGTTIARQLVRSGQIDPELWLDEDGPRVVTAVEGSALQRAREYWEQVLELFPEAQKHNRIDRELLHVE